MNIKTLVLTLENSIDRQTHVSNVFGNREYEFFKVTTPKDNSFPGYSLEETGCAIAHMDMVETALDSDLDYLIIMEDDVVLQDGYDKIVTTLNEIEKTTDFDVLLLSTRSYDGCGFRVYRKTASGNKTLDEFNYFPAETMTGYVGTHSYVVSKKAFEKLYKLRKENKVAADSWSAFVYEGLKVFHMYPHVTDADMTLKTTIGHHAPQIAFLEK